MVEIRVSIVAEGITTPLREVKAKVSSGGLGSYQCEEGLGKHGVNGDEMTEIEESFRKRTLGYVVSRSEELEVKKQSCRKEKESSLSQLYSHTRMRWGRDARSGRTHTLGCRAGQAEKIVSNLAC